MTRQLNYLASARGDLEAIANYLEDETGSAALADAFADRLRAKCRKLAALPGALGTERPEFQTDIRSTPCEGYVIYFRYSADAVEIINFLHGSRDAQAHFHR